jgi:hypothetical protein
MDTMEEHLRKVIEELRIEIEGEEYEVLFRVGARYILDTLSDILMEEP